MRSTVYGLGKSILYVTSAGPLFLFCYFVFVFPDTLFTLLVTKL